MKSTDELPELIGEVMKSLSVMKKMSVFFSDFQVRHPVWTSLDTETAMGIAQFFSNFYTCAETSLFRIASFFENNLEKERWHSHLLNRMTLSIPGERPAVLRDETAAVLLEFLKFRHFTRYYFEFDYDREKLEFLGKKFSRAYQSCLSDLEEFLKYLGELSAQN